MPFRALSLVLAWGLATAPPGTGASARAEPPRVLLWPDSPELAPELPTTAVDPRFELADRAAFEAELEQARAEVAADVTAALGEVEAALQRARDHYVAQRWDAMLAELEGAERDRLTVLADPRHCGALWELEFRLGLALRGRKRAGDAEQAARRNALALALAPERRPPREVYGPEVVGEFLRAVEAEGNRVAVPVSLTVSPPDALVHVDCKPVRTARVSLRPGLHVIHARAVGYAATARVFEVPEGAPLELVLVADDTGDAVRRLGRALEHGALVLELPSHRRALVEAARARDIDVVVWLDRRADAVLARAWVGAGSGPTVRRASVDEAIAAVLGGVRDDGTLGTAASTGVTPAPRPVAPTKPARKPVVRTWWLWTIVGVAAVGVVGLGLGLGLRKDASDRLIIYGPR